MSDDRIDFGILYAPATDVNKPSASTNDAFYRWLLTERGVSERWAREIRYIIGKILREMPDLILDEKKATDLVGIILTSKLSKSTKRHYLRAIEHYMAYLGRPMKFKKPRDTLRCPVYLTQAQMGRLIRASKNYKEMAILTFFCTTGVRLGELVHTDLRDLDFQRKIVRIRTAKMDKQREIPMSDQLERVLMAYLATVPADKRKPSDPLFRSNRGDRIAPRTVGTIVEQASRRAGLEGVHPHVLRHSFATAWVDNGGDQFHLKDLLGHSDIKMTERYWHLNTKSKTEAFARAAPRL